MARQSPTTYVIIMNGSNIEIDVHRLSDGGLLLSYDGSSHTTYMKEEVDRQVALESLCPDSSDSFVSSLLFFCIPSSPQLPHHRWQQDLCI